MHFLNFVTYIFEILDFRYTQTFLRFDSNIAALFYVQTHLKTEKFPKERGTLSPLRPIPGTPIRPCNQRPNKIMITPVQMAYVLLQKYGNMRPSPIIILKAPCLKQIQIWASYTIPQANGPRGVLPNSHCSLVHTHGDQVQSLFNAKIRFAYYFQKYNLSIMKMIWSRKSWDWVGFLDGI